MTGHEADGFNQWGLFGAVLALVAAWSLIIIAALRVMFSRGIKNIEDKLIAFGETQKACTTLQRELLELKADLALSYVRREDFIRFDVVINSKLDKLRDLVVEALRGKKEC
jgi:hypothetical protein